MCRHNKVMLRRMICSVQMLKKQCDAKGLVLAAMKAGDFTLRLKWASIKRVARASVKHPSSVYQLSHVFASQASHPPHELQPSPSPDCLQLS